MTPMVDIGFLLLIFFMATTVFKKPEEVAVRVPQSHSAIQLPETGIIVITIPAGKNGAEDPILLTLNDAAADVRFGLSTVSGLSVKGIRFTTAEIVPKIEELMINRMVEKVVLKADRNAKYGTIEKIMETLQKNDLLFVNLVTDLEEG
jgi:biopolymer transport protein ExbD